MNISRNAIIGLGLFVVILVVYIFTLCPTIYFGESAKFVALATGQSITKPVSHPTWFFIAKVFKLFSPSNPAWGLNFMSAVFGAWTIALLYMILANMNHDRTTEEMSRFSHIPYLRQVSALAGCLLLAFSPLYWGASVVAGPSTMKAFLFVLTGFYLVKYIFLKKKRYLLYFSAAYGVALANAPVMLFFAPVAFLVILLWCREILEDAFAVGLSAILLFIGFAVFAAAVPKSYITRPINYLAPPNIIQALSYYQEWYYYDLKSMLPVKRDLLLIAAWLLFLILPAFLPIVYLLWRKRPGVAATRSTFFTVVKYLLMLAFTGLGFAYLFGYDLYTITHISNREMLPPVYLVPLILISSWMAYFIGYWMINMSGRISDSALGSDKYSSGYRKPVYSFLVAIALVIPIVLFALSCPKSSKRNSTLLRDYCSDVLASCKPGSVIVVPDVRTIKGTFHGLGDALNYINAYPVSPEEYGYAGPDTAEKVVLDFPTARDYVRLNRLDLEKYIISTIWQDEESSRAFRGFSDVKRSPYDRVIQETIGTENFNEVYFLHDYMVFTPQNQLINRRINLAPTGLLYKVTFYGSTDYIPRDLVAENRTLWENFSVNDYIKKAKIRQQDYYTKESGRRKRFTPEGNMLNNYSRLANDAGVLCTEQGLTKEAGEYYELALEFNKDNYSALQNLAQILGDRDGQEARIQTLTQDAEEIRTETRKLIEEQDIKAEQLLEDDKALREARETETTLHLVWLYGYVLDSSFYGSYVAALYGFAAQYPADERAPYDDLRYKMLHLALAVDPTLPSLLLQNASFLQKSQLFIDRIQAIIEYQSALEHGAERERLILQAIAKNYALIATERMQANDDENAVVYRDVTERFLKRALEAPSTEEDPTRAWMSDILSEFLLLDLYAKLRFNLDEALTMAKEINQSVSKDHLAIFLKSTDYVFLIMILQGKHDEISAYVEDFAKKNPELEDVIKKSLAGLYVSQNKMKEAGRIFEKIRERVEDTDGKIAFTLAKLYAEQEEWEKVIALEMNATQGEEIVLSGFHLLKGHAYHQQNQFSKAIEEFELAFKYYQDARESAGSLVGMDDPKILNALAWVYYLTGWPERETAEGKDYLDTALKYSREVYENTRRKRISDVATLELWDTYAWILYRYTEEKSEAFSIMQKIYTGSPGHPQIKYHYGAMLCERGKETDMPKKTAEGLKLVAEAYASGLQYFEQKEAKALLSENNIPLPEVVEEE